MNIKILLIFIVVILIVAGGVFYFSYQKGVTPLAPTEEVSTIRQKDRSEVENE